MWNFIDRLKRSEVGEDIARIVHYGSTLRGDWNEESDVDLLIVATGDLRKVREVCLDLSFELMLNRGELVQPMVYCPDVWRKPNYFLYGVRKTGEEVFAVDETTLEKREATDLLELAREYLAMAESLMLPESIRGVVDLAYNSVELCAKGLVLMEGAELPKTHSGLVNRFGELLVKEGKVTPELGRRVHRGLDRRNRARYDPHSVLVPEDAEEVLELGRGMIEALEEWL